MTTDANIVIGVEGRIEGGKVVQRTLDDIEKSGRQAQKSTKDLKDEFTRTDGAARLLSNTLKVLGVSFGLRQLQLTVDTWSDLNSRLKIATGSTEAATATMKRLSDIARVTYTSLQLTADGFAKNAFTLKALGKSTEEQLDFTEALNNALVVSGAKGQNFELVQNAMNRAMAEGTMRGQELDIVLNYGSRVAEALAEQLGVNVTQLRALAKDGKITGDVIFNSLVSNMQELHDEAESMPATIGDAFILLQNSFLKTIGVFDQTNKLSEDLAKNIIKVADNIGILTDALIIGAGAWVAYRGAALLALGAGVLSAVAGNVAAFVQLAAGIRTAAGATALLNAAFMTGPGALFAVLGAVAGAAWVFRKELEASLIFVVTEAIIAVDTLIIKLKELADFGTTGLGALFATGAAKMGLVDENALMEVLAEEGNRKKNFKGASGFTADQLRNEANEMIGGLGSGSAGPEVDLSGNGGASPAAQLSEEATKAQKAIDKVTESLRFQLAQLKRNDVEQEIYNNLKAAGVGLDSAAGKEIAELTRQLDDNTKQLERQERVFDTLADASSNFLKDTIKGVGSLGDRIKSLIADFADLAYQMAVIEPIKQNLFGSSSSSGSGLFGALFSGIGNLFNSGPSAAIAQAAARGAANPALFGPGFDSGGSMVLGGKSGIDRNQLSLNGVPIAKVGRGETLSVSPTHKDGGGKAPVVVNQTINLSMGVAQAVAAEMATFLPQIARVTQSGIEEAQMRGIKA